MSKNSVCGWLRRLSLLLMVAFSGCAADYHAYQDCCVPYLYCPPRPLPYTTYEDCHCPTPVALQYLPSEMEVPTPASSHAERAEVPSPVQPTPLGPVPR